MTVPVVTLFSGILCVTFLWWVVLTQVCYQDDAVGAPASSSENVAVSASAGEDNGRDGLERQSTNNGWRIRAESTAFANATGSSCQCYGNGNLFLGEAAMFLGVPRQRWIFATIFALAIGIRGLAKGQLSLSGLVAGVALCMISVLANYATTAAGMAFYFSSSAATNFRAAKKKKIDASFKEGGQRNWAQAIACGGVAAEMCLLQLVIVGAGEKPVDFNADFWHSYLSMAALGSTACSNGDTWASEFGTVFETTQPRLITNLRIVPKGTNGAVTVGGLLVSILGGVVVGVTHYGALAVALALEVTPGAHKSYRLQWLIVVIGATAGLFGSVVDSLLGATCQFTGVDKSTGLIVDGEEFYQSKKGRAEGDSKGAMGKPGSKEAHTVAVKRISGIPLLSNCGVNLVSCALSALFAAELSRLIWPA